MFDNMLCDVFSGAFAKPAPGMFKFSFDGRIAVKVPGSNVTYKTFDPKMCRLTNCTSFLLPVDANEFFFTIPTNKVKCGDIIIVNSPNGPRPRCVIKTDGCLITAFNYETGNIETFPPEHHVFMGNTYLYGKVFSPFGSMFKEGNTSAFANIMKMSMITNMMNGSTSDSSNNFMVPLIMMSVLNRGSDSNSGLDGMFDGLFDADEFDFSSLSTDEECDSIPSPVKRNTLNKDAHAVSDDNNESNE